MKLFKLLLLSLSMFSVLAGSNLKDAFSGKKFFYLDQNDRIEILKDLYRQTKNEYALWEIKKRRVNVDGDEVFTSAIEAESKIANAESAFDQAKGNLDYIDRVKAVIASFKDTHYGIRPKVSGSWVVSGFNTNLIDGKVYITGKYEKVLAKTLLDSENAFNISKVSIGDEVLEIDGVKVLDAAKKLEKYIDASSEGFLKEQAAKFLLERYFSYPTKPYVDMKVKSKDSEEEILVRLPYYYSDRAERKDAKFYFSKIGIKSLKDIRFKYDEKKKVWVADRNLKFVGYDRISLPKGGILLKDYMNAKQGGSSILKLAIILKDAKAYGFVQLNSFAVSKLYENGREVSFPNAISEVTKYLKEQNLDMIFDIRHNGGGNGGYPAIVLSNFAKKEESYKQTTWAKRVTRYMRQFLDFYRTDELFQQIGEGSFWTLLMDEFYNSVAVRNEHTPALSRENIKYVGEGYEGKIVALISPSCISACDIMSMLLSSSKRAKLIGTTANGTGAGYYSNQHFNTQYEDPFKIFATQIPNTLFGYPGATDGMNTYGADSAYELNSENVPVVADIQYQATLKDFTEGHVDWINKAIEELNK